MKKKALVEAIMEDTGCKKSTAYNAIHQAVGKSIRLNDAGEFTVITQAK